MHLQSRGERIFNGFNIGLLSVIGFLAIYPFIYVLTLSLSTATDVARGGLHLYPREISWTAYQMVLTDPGIRTGYLNSLFRTVAGTGLTLLMTSLAAYPLARKRMPFRKQLLFFLLFTMLFSGGLVPYYLLIRSLGLTDNRLVYVLPTMLSAFNIIVLKNFFQQIPESLEESARMDGAGDFSILFRIFIPLSKPALATIALWTAVFHWNAWFDALIFITDDSRQVLQIFLQRIVIENTTEVIEMGLAQPDVTQFSSETIKAATVVVTIIPMLLVYPFVQRYFVKGTLLGGIKE
jgi:putative aldouronate transport system permease protein